MGASTYSYEIVRRAENRNPLLTKKLKGAPFPFPLEFEHVIMDKQGDDNRIHCEAIWTEGAGKSSLRHKIKIVAINDVGIGQYYENRTFCRQMIFN